MDKTIGLEIIGLAYMLIFTFVFTVGSIGGLKKMLSENSTTAVTTILKKILISDFLFFPE